ncbi:MAG: LysR family transcriptional regulator [Pseudomonadota bacterium]
MNDWSEFKTAMIVAKLGSISAASSALGIHRATVSRHIDVVENTLGATLFVRHPRGVELTDAGLDMLEVTQSVQHMLDSLKGKTRNAHATQSGKLVISTVWGVLPLIMPAIKLFNAKYPNVSVHCFTGEETVRLEYGEAHVALRGGPKPTELDYVVRCLEPVRFSPFIEKGALYKYESSSDFEDWRDLPYIWVFDNERQRFAKWIKPHMSLEDAALIVNTPEAVLPAVLAGVGVGYLPRHIGSQYEQLVELDPMNDDKFIPLWVISHRDLNKSPKVTEFIRLLMETETGLEGRK